MTAADTAAEPGCSKLLRVSFDLVGEDLKGVEPRCQTGRLRAGAGLVCGSQTEDFSRPHPAGDGTRWLLMSAQIT